MDGNENLENTNETQAGDGSAVIAESKAESGADAVTVSESTPENSGAPADADAEGKAASAAPAKKYFDGFFDIFEMFAICTAVILLLFSYVGRLTVVDGESMEDTLHDRDYLIVQSLGYTPHRGDIVVLQKILL